VREPDARWYRGSTPATAYLTIALALVVTAAALPPRAPSTTTAIAAYIALLGGALCFARRALAGLRTSRDGVLIRNTLSTRLIGWTDVQSFGVEESRSHTSSRILVNTRREQIRTTVIHFHDTRGAATKLAAVLNTELALRRDTLDD
jgi:hypothetical protein